MIETKRLILRPHILDDFEASYAMVSDPQVVRFIGGTPISREDVWNRLLRYAGHWSLLGYGLFAIIEKETGRLLGETGLADFHRGLGGAVRPVCRSGWVMAKTAHGQGFAGEAVAAAHEWFDTNHRETRTVCIIHPDNSASVRLAEKLSYTPFGQASYRGASVIMFERLNS